MSNRDSFLGMSITEILIYLEQEKGNRSKINQQKLDQIISDEEELYLVHEELRWCYDYINQLCKHQERLRKTLQLRNCKLYREFIEIYKDKLKLKKGE